MGSISVFPTTETNWKQSSAPSFPLSGIRITLSRVRARVAGHGLRFSANISINFPGKADSAHTLSVQLQGSCLQGCTIKLMENVYLKHLKPMLLPRFTPHHVKKKKSGYLGQVNSWIWFVTVVLAQLKAWHRTGRSRGSCSQYCH